MYFISWVLILTKKMNIPKPKYSGVLSLPYGLRRDLPTL